MRKQIVYEFCPICDENIKSHYGESNKETPHENVRDCIRYLKLTIQELKSDFQSLARS